MRSLKSIRSNRYHVQFILLIRYKALNRTEPNKNDVTKGRLM